MAFLVVFTLKFPSSKGRVGHACELRVLSRSDETINLITLKVTSIRILLKFLFINISKSVLTTMQNYEHDLNRFSIIALSMSGHSLFSIHHSHYVYPRTVSILNSHFSCFLWVDSLHSQFPILMLPRHLKSLFSIHYYLITYVKIVSTLNSQFLDYLYEECLRF